MEIFLKFLYVFLAGGALCMLGQVLVLKTNFTPARILVCFVTLGVILQGLTLFEPIKQVVGSGITVPITGFGGTLTKGAIDGVNENGFLGILTGGVMAAAAGIAVAIVSAFLVALIARSRSK
jgi:stage V sporulation protein AE